MAEHYREHNSGCSYWNLKFDPNTLRGFLEQFYCSTSFSCAVWFPILPSYYLRNFLLNWPLGLYFREENSAMQLLNGFLLIYWHTFGPSPSGMTVHTLMSVHSQSPAELLLWLKVQMSICSLGSLILRNWEQFIHCIEKRNNGLKSREIKMKLSHCPLQGLEMLPQSPRDIYWDHMSKCLKNDMGLKIKINYWLLKTDSTICVRAQENFSI